MRQWQDAAMLYETAGAYEKAAEIHITTKNFAQAAPLMNSISTPKLHLLYAQAKEAEGETATALHYLRSPMLSPECVSVWR
jgi:WD repeat-containing protein 19